MALRITSRFPSFIVVDGTIINISIKRLTPEESVRFKRQFGKIARRGAVSVPAGLSEEELRELEERGDKDEMDARDFIVSAINDYVVPEPGQLYDDDVEVTTGEGLAKAFGARENVLAELLQLIFMENTLSAEMKARWRTELAPFVPTPTDVADRMCELAGVGPGDRVVDLGAGTGALCFAAARRGATAVGYELDEGRRDEAAAAAAVAGVADRCTFVCADAAGADLTEATVVMIYLLESSNIRLKEKLKALPKGTRIVSHAFTMGADWPFVRHEDVPVPEGEERKHTGQRHLYLYRVS